MGGGDSKGFDIIVSSPKKVVSIKLEVELIHEIDAVWQKLGYRSRSEFLREAILYFLQVAPRLKASMEKPPDAPGPEEEVDEGEEALPEEA
ncbi:MAG: ribbon-helix-helix protein, CopG family [Crenarchaeota archaeon]|nr:ribbon-helix-helix protein, CopG family [Thermoproteota archaeon]